MGEKGKDEGIDPTRIESAIVEIRNQRVILDPDLAKLYGVETKRLNEQVKLNTAKFGEGYAFRLTKEEFDALKSQSATSNPGRDGRRYPPWAFTEHGVVMAATILDSIQAVEASKLIVGVFIEVRRRLNSSSAESMVPLADTAGTLSPLGRLAAGGQGIVRLQRALDHVLDSVIDSEKQKTVRDEVMDGDAGAAHIAVATVHQMDFLLTRMVNSLCA